MDRDSGGIPSSRLKEFEWDSLLFHSVFQNIVASDNEDNSSILDIAKINIYFWMDWQRKILEQGGYRFGIAGAGGLQGIQLTLSYRHLIWIYSVYAKLF